MPNQRNIGRAAAGSAAATLALAGARSPGRSGASSTGLPSYFTTFALTENPISEGGKWHASGLGLTRSDIGQGALPGSSTPVITSGGKAYGTSSTTSASGYDDARALLSGFPANHSASATLAVGSPTGTYSEVELHLRFDDSGTYARGYELLMSAYGQYMGVVRWNGDGTFTELYQYGTFSPPSNGDVYFAQIVGNVITCKMNGVTRFVYDVTTASGVALPSTTGLPNSNGNGSAIVFPDGNPGMGFDTDGDDSAFAFADFAAVGL